MATPDSQNTTPSPILPPRQMDPDLTASRLDDDHHSMDRPSGIETFLARAEFAKLTRALRARLSYASYKATHNLSHIPLGTLEHQLSPVPPTNKRQSSASPKRRLSHNQMMPPPASPLGRSLYSALLGPDSAESASPRSSRRPRLSFPNAQDSHPHLLTPQRVSPRLHASSARHSPEKKPSQRARTRASISATERDDINAATTLTSLLLKKPSPNGPPSPSSLSRTSSSGSSAGIFQPSSQPTGTSHYHHLSPASASQRVSTPKPEDALDAAELMLFLATSPSPARATAPRGPSTHAGRVLFPTSSLSSAGSSNDDVSTLGGSQPDPMTQHRPPPAHLFPSSPTPQAMSLRSTAQHTPLSSYTLADYIHVSPSPGAKFRSGVLRSAGGTEGRRLFDDGNIGGVSRTVRSVRSGSEDDGDARRDHDDGASRSGMIGGLEAGIDLVGASA
ncbi:hypothetical protein BOTBODRAFT_174428 [Botryobasidium botryosum FD-172 SS1]|uniref:Uncharacterized protein n=1 Tax=Botryobasidium botryosum (strain FD-172 SS1) TaxID=930990 RepID=A0A067MSV1_BOTB1|nr:hypothetical protein BOTBODRAFT_174428 [Botryobasidium botryosum FD-172 SS1]